MKAEMTSCNYVIEMSNKEFLRIMRKDDKWIAGESDEYLINILENAGAMDVDYDGMTGAEVRLTIYPDETNIDEMIEIIENYIEGEPDVD